MTHANGSRNPRTLAVLGSTGSIGLQALEVAARARGRIIVTALGAGRRLDALVEQCARWKPGWVALEHAADPSGARAMLERAAPTADIRVGSGSAAWLAGECGADIVLNGIVGAAGLEPSLATLERGARLALANKETLVIGGPLVRAALARGRGELIPVDSEHSAALQCLQGRPPADVAWLTLTASGGPLRAHRDWRSATREEVLAHPVWAMGARITVDSALLFNKGLELIEARALFDLEWEQLGAVIHPQALIHAMATFRDGSMVAQAAHPDMRLPIQLAMSWPERWAEAVAPIAARDLEGLTFAPIATGDHPAFDIALMAGRAGGTAPCVLNAADEVAVQAFLDGDIALGQVPELLRRVLGAHTVERVDSLDQLRRLDRWARETAHEALLEVKR